MPQSLSQSPVIWVPSTPSRSLTLLPSRSPDGPRPETQGFTHVSGCPPSFSCSPSLPPSSSCPPSLSHPPSLSLPPSLPGLANSSWSLCSVPLSESHSLLWSHPQCFSWSQPFLTPGVLRSMGSLHEGRTRFFCAQVATQPWFRCSCPQFTCGETAAREGGLHMNSLI